MTTETKTKTKTTSTPYITTIISPPSPLTTPTPTLILSHPTPAECSHIYSLTSRDWGSALPTPEHYIQRERFLTHLPLAQRGSARQWILTTPAPPGVRAILTSCDTLRRRGLVAGKDGAVEEVEVQAIGAVYTDEKYRGKGYARRLMELLQAEFEQPSSRLGHRTPGFSVLYSDIGKMYYAKMGWKPHESRHVDIVPSKDGLPTVENLSLPEVKAGLLRMHDLAELCVIDEVIIRRTLAKARIPAVALIPDYDTMLWHHLREDFMTTNILSKSPSIRGAIAGPPGRRVWAVWVRSYYSGGTDPSGNTMHILRLAFENPEETEKEELAAGLRSIFDLAVREAAEWVTSSVQMWNPPKEVIEALQRAGIQFSAVEREQSSIPSVMMHGSYEDKEPAMWAANEKFGWY